MKVLSKTNDHYVEEPLVNQLVVLLNFFFDNVLLLCNCNRPKQNYHCSSSHVLHNWSKKKSIKQEYSMANNSTLSTRFYPQDNIELNFATINIIFIIGLKWNKSICFDGGRRCGTFRKSQVVLLKFSWPLVHRF